MARSRSIPTNLFDDPSFFERQSDTQVVLLGLILQADDYGRGPAHTKLLTRKFDKTESVIEQALQELEACGLVVCYQVEQQRYYSLCRWQEWETLHKKTPSKYPVPPTEGQEHATVSISSATFNRSPNFPEFSGGISAKSRKEKISQNFPGEAQKSSSEVEGEGEGEGEQEQEQEGEGNTAQLHPNMIAFPIPSSSGTTDVARDALVKLTHELANILKLPITEGLSRLVVEYHANPHLSLLGEADAAREWIDNRTRNPKHQQMGLAFFRRWLRREYEATLARQKHREQHEATGTTGSQETPMAVRQSLMDLEAHYRTSRQNTVGKETHDAQETTSTE